MEREILFRGKRRDNGEWIIGYYLVVGGISYILPEKYFLNGIVEVDTSTVCQYTGLTDENGVKIFEGDILKSKHASYIKHDFKEFVVFHKGRFCATPDNECFWCIFGEYMERCEVIGNIYDNKGLLNGGKNE